MTKSLTEKDIKRIMQSPKYWRDQDPETLKIVECWFEKQYGLDYQIKAQKEVADRLNLEQQLKEANEMLKSAKHLTVKDSNGAIMFELVSPEINDYLEKWSVK